MAVRTFGTGGTYPTLTAAWAAAPSVFTEVEIFECTDSDVVETSGVALTGKTTSAAFYALIRAAAGAEATTQPRAVRGAGARISATVGDGVIRVGSVQHIRIENIELYNASTSTLAAVLKYSDGTFSAGANDHRVSGCIFGIAATTGTSPAIAASKANLIFDIRNTIVYGGTRSIDTRDSAVVTGYNNTFWRTQAQIGVLSDTEATWINCYSGSSVAGAECYFTGASAPAGSNNASSDTTATVDYTSSLNNIAGSAVFVSVTPGAENFALISGTNALVNAGTTVGSVTTDIMGTSRPQGAAYDIGAFERVESSTITGTFAVTEGPDVFVATGTQINAGTFATTEGADILAATGNVGSDVTGTFAVTEGSDVFAATGVVINAGTFAATEGADVFAASSSAVGTLSIGPIVDAQGNLRVSESGATLYVYSNTTAQLVVALPAQTINASGYLVATDALIIAGTPYRTRVRLADNTDDLPQDTAT